MSRFNWSPKSADMQDLLLVRWPAMIRLERGMQVYEWERAGLL